MDENDKDGWKGGKIVGGRAQMLKFAPETYSRGGVPLHRPITLPITEMFVFGLVLRWREGDFVD